MPWATIRPRYSGNCSQRDPKISIGTGRNDLPFGAREASVWRFMFVGSRGLRTAGSGGFNASHPAGEGQVAAPARGKNAAGAPNYDGVFPPQLLFLFPGG